MQLLSSSFLTGPATKQSKVVRLQLLPSSPLTGPTAKKISSSQIAVATVAFLILNGPAAQEISSSQIAVAALQPSCWACRHKISSSQIAVATLQLSCWACRPKKNSSSQIAVAALQPSCWACRHKNLKYAECSCYPAAFLLGLPPKNPKGPIAVSALCWAYRQKISSSQIAVATVAFLILNGPAIQKISSSQIAVTTLQPSCWAYRQKIPSIVRSQLLLWSS